MHAQKPCSQGQGSIIPAVVFKKEKEATLKRLALAGRATSSRPAISVDEILTRSSVMFHNHNTPASSWVLQFEFGRRLLNGRPGFMRLLLSAPLSGPQPSGPGPNSLSDPQLAPKPTAHSPAMPSCRRLHGRLHN